MKKVLKSLVMFFTGFSHYLLIEYMFRGYTFVLMGVLGGIAIVILDKINDEISWNVDLLVQSMLGANLITFMELVVGLIAKYTSLLPVMWDYSNMPLNYKGIICIPFYAAWMALSIVAIFIADAINYYIFHDTICPYYLLFGGQIRLKFIARK